MQYRLLCPRKGFERNALSCVACSVSVLKGKNLEQHSHVRMALFDLIQRPDRCV